MNRPWIFRAALLTLLAMAAPLALASVQVQLDGVLAEPGQRMLGDGARLSDAALATALLPQTYVLGGAWLRPSLLMPQRRLKAGLLFDLTRLHRLALARQHAGLAARSRALADWIRALPVTGRQRAQLDPRVVELDPAENLPLATGDRLYYPARPDTIRIVGAVTAVCTLAQIPLQDALTYLQGCRSDSVADRDVFYVIQPDGRVFEQGRALWNRSAPMSLAPGAMIYIPLRANLIALVDPALNRDLASFLATQLLPGPVASP